jgi:hypothetical protein
VLFGVSNIVHGKRAAYKTSGWQGRILSSMLHAVTAQWVSLIYNHRFSSPGMNHYQSLCNKLRVARAKKIIGGVSPTIH